MDPDSDRVRIALSTDPGRTTAPLESAETPPFRILVIGDFSGRGRLDDAPGPPLNERRVVAVTDPDELLRDLRPRVSFELAGPGRVSFDVRQIADFRPDRLVKRVPHLQGLRASIASAVAGAGGAPDGVAASQGDSRGPDGGGGGEPPEAPAASESLLDDIVEATPRVEATADSGPLGDLSAWVRDVVQEHRVPDESDAQSELRARLEREAARRIVEVLHAPAVRDLETLWRSLLFLLARVEWPEVRCYVLDVSRAELAADMGTPDPAALERSRLARALLEPLPGRGEGAPALAVLAEELGGEARDVALLNRLAILAHASGIPLLAGAGAGLLGLEGWADPPADYDWPEPDTPAWDAFRQTEAAASVGLVAPRYLVRLPYGEDTDPCEVLAVEEADLAAGDAFLWGNPAFPAAAALARSFLERGWSLSPGPRELSGLPIHVGAAGAVLAHPVEAVWNAEALRRVGDRGVVPLAGYRQEARLRVPALFSTQEGGAALSAWWSAG